MHNRVVDRDPSLVANQILFTVLRDRDALKDLSSSFEAGVRSAASLGGLNQDVFGVIESFLVTYPLAENEEQNEELNKVLREVLRANPNFLSELQNLPLPTNRPNQAVAQAAAAQSGNSGLDGGTKYERQT